VIIEIESLTKDYGSTKALKGVSLRIEAGGIVGLLGPNGAGKTTLVEIIEGLREPTAGRLSVLGLDPVRNARVLRERIGVQLQSTSLPQELTPEETLRVFGAMYGKALRPKDILQRIGFAAEAKKRNSALSEGQRRRLAIGMALINDPELIILDEPTSGLDPVARREMHDLFSSLRDSERTVLLTTHYIEEAEALCDRVIMLRSGEIVADGSPFELVVKAGGTSTIWFTVQGDFDPAPLLQTGATPRGREGDYLRFSTPDPTAAILALGEALRSRRATLTDLRMRRPTLEDVYLDLMGNTANQNPSTELA